MAAVKRSLNVGVVGMGRMGIPISRNLAFKARSAMYLQLHSRTLSKARKVCDDMGVDGATCAMRIHDRYNTMTKWCDVILLTLANRDASRHVLLEDAEALITNARQGQIIVDHTTVDIELSRECAAEAERRGAVFLDAPMSGSPQAAFNGQMVLMVGGPAETFQRLQPIFRMYADSLHHMGGSGSGTATKLLSQALVASHNAAAAEAMTIANRLGIEDQAQLTKVLDASWGSSTMLRRNAPTMQDLVRNPDKLPPTSSATVDRLLEDLSLLDASLPKIDAHGRFIRRRPNPSAVGSRAAAYGDVPANEEEEGEDEVFPVLDASLRMLGATAEAGYGDRDLSSVIHFIQGAVELERQEREERRWGDSNTFVPRGLSAAALGGGASASSSASSTDVAGGLRKGKEEEEKSAASDSKLSDGRGGGGASEPIEFTSEDFY